MVAWNVQQTGSTAAYKLAPPARSLTAGQYRRLSRKMAACAGHQFRHSMLALSPRSWAKANTTLPVRSDSGRWLRGISRALLGSLRRGDRCAGRLALARVGSLARDRGEHGGHFTDQRVLERSTFCQRRANTGGMAVRVPHPPSRSANSRRWGAAAQSASSIFMSAAGI